MQQYFWPFQAKGAWYRRQALDAEEVAEAGFYFPRLYTPRRVGSQILVLRLLHFLSPPTQNSKDLENSTNSCHPKAGKPIGAPNKLLAYIYLLCIPFKILERLIYARVKPIAETLLRQEQGGSRHGRSTVDQVTLLTQDVEDSFG